MHEIESRDLNLLAVLRVLLEEGSVTRAGRRLGLSPSATSHALGRLREAFGDGLLVREGNAMLPTPRAEALRPALERVLDDVGLLYRDRPSFDPARSTRRFTLAASDLLAPLVPDLVATLGAEAPSIGLDLVGEIGAAETRVFSTGRVDLGLQSLPPEVPGIESERVGESDFVVAARADHPFLERPTLRAWSETPQVAIATGRPGAGFVGEVVAEREVERRVALRVPSFLLAMHALADTSLLFSAPGALVRPVAQQLGLATVPHPLRLAPVQVAVVWHERFARDPGHRWFRERVRDVVAQHFPPVRG